MSTKRALQPVKQARIAGRTGTQVAGPAAIIALLAAFDLIHWNETQTGAVLLLSVPAWAFVQNIWERWSGRWFLIARK